MVNPEHPETRDDLEVDGVIDALRQLMDAGKNLVRAVGERYLLLTGDGPELVDFDGLPEEEKEERKFSHRKRKLARGDDVSKLARQSSYKGQSPEKIANRSSDNPYIFSDVLNDPGLVDASGETEAVAKIAEQNPGWAKMSDAVEAHGLEADADGNVSPAGDSGDGNGASGSSAAEAASDAAAYSGDVSTADAGDLGPTGPSGYGMDGGSSGGDAGGSGGSGSGGSSGGAGDGGIGGSAGGDAL
ncbi:hypothetical protein [Halorarum halobium]|uniref:hypothetical protein n=1 Tax=Halorarum halobium TaxID=3075121 RepID=UPI0028B0288D|nr:hypothetical protein [Halobaculum sp. XH14]